MIAVDWGTSSFRAYRVDAEGRITDRRTAARGILTVEAGGFAGVLGEEIGAWLEHEPGAVFMSGMIGSRQGWREVPYLSCPADLDSIAAACVDVEWRGGRATQHRHRPRQCYRDRRGTRDTAPLSTPAGSRSCRS